MQYYGGAITSGYFPNPNLNIPYDSCVSSSSVFNSYMLEILEPEGYYILKDYNFTITVSLIQTFYSPKDLAHPLEYEITPVDEIVNLYINKQIKNYSELLEPENFDIFINDSLKIFEKYKTECNPQNKKLLLITDECDGKFGENVHGGFICGEDGFWNKNCVAFYCDIGLFFDNDEQNCIKDPCGYEDEDGNKDNSLTFIIVTIIIVSFIIIIILGLIICFYLNKKRRSLRNKSDSNSKNNSGAKVSLVSEKEESTLNK